MAEKELIRSYTFSERTLKEAIRDYIKFSFGDVVDVNDITISIHPGSGQAGFTVPFLQEINAKVMK